MLWFDLIWYKNPHLYSNHSQFFFLFVFNGEGTNIYLTLIFLKDLNSVQQFCCLWFRSKHYFEMNQVSLQRDVWFSIPPQPAWNHVSISHLFLTLWLINVRKKCVSSFVNHISVKKGLWWVAVSQFPPCKWWCIKWMNSLIAIIACGQSKSWLFSRSTSAPCHTTPLM